MRLFLIAAAASLVLAAEAPLARAATPDIWRSCGRTHIATDYDENTELLVSTIKRYKTRQRCHYYRDLARTAAQLNFPRRLEGFRRDGDVYLYRSQYTVEYRKGRQHIIIVEYV